MAYNSDGYIMIDFTEVDFRRTNQTIEGLFKRCVDVIGTNKFILVINANGRTPLPATCSFTNNQYVIDTCIYMFAISSNDNLFIRRNDVPASDIIDDSSISVDKTWSSNKIDSELDGKQDTLTAGTNITIDENNVISSTGGAVIDDSVIVNNKVWSSLNTVEKLAPIDTIINNPVEFKTSLDLPLIACKVSFSATQAGSGDPSPSNPRAISGVSAIGLTANSTPVSVSLGDTRYGGELDVLTGILTVTFFYVRVTTVASVIDAQTARVNLISMGYPSASGYYKYQNPFKCNIFKSTDYSADAPHDDRIYFVNTSAFAILSSSEIGTTVSDWEDFFDDNPCYTAYKMATPITIQLSANELSSIIGNNTISTDGDILTVSYRHLPIDLI